MSPGHAEIDLSLEPLYSAPTYRLCSSYVVHFMCHAEGLAIIILTLHNCHAGSHCAFTVPENLPLHIAAHPSAKLLDVCMTKCTVSVSRLLHQSFLVGHVSACH